MLGIEKELVVFGVSFLNGITIAAIYGAIRIFRRMIRHNLFWISLEDVSFWLFSAIFLFTEMYRVCAGSIRWYYVIGVILGGCITCIIVQKVLKKYIDKCKKTR